MSDCTLSATPCCITLGAHQSLGPALVPVHACAAHAACKNLDALRSHVRAWRAALCTQHLMVLRLARPLSKSVWCEQACMST